MLWRESRADGCEHYHYFSWRVCGKAGQMSRNVSLHVNKSNADIMYVKCWQSSKLCTKASCFGYTGVRKICPTMTMDFDRVEKLYPPLSDSQYLLTGRDFPDQSEQSSFEFCEWRGAEVVVWIQSEARCHLVCSMLHKYSHYLMSEKNQLTELPHLRKEYMPGRSVFAGHWYQQHGICNKCWSQSLGYHSYLTPSSYRLKDSVVFVYMTSFAVVKNLQQNHGERDGAGYKRTRRNQEEQKVRHKTEV